MRLLAIRAAKSAIQVAIRKIGASLKDSDYLFLAQGQSHIDKCVAALNALNVDIALAYEVREVLNRKYWMEEAVVHVRGGIPSSFPINPTWGKQVQSLDGAEVYMLDGMKVFNMSGVRCFHSRTKTITWVPSTWLETPL